MKDPVRTALSVLISRKVRSRPTLSAGMLFIVLVSVGSASRATSQEAVDEIESLMAFARLYGNVRYFHPSDEAAGIDWDAFAIHGVERVRTAEDRDELRETLEDLYLPVAPSLRIFPAGESPPPASRLIPADTTGLEVVAWQHLGAGLGEVSGLYQSVRRNRKPVRSAGSFGPIIQNVDAQAYQGRRVRLRGAVRAEVDGLGNQGALWLRVDRPNQRGAFLDNMNDRPITSPEWATYGIEGQVAEDAERIAFGAFLLGEGQLWVDGFELTMESPDGSWTTITIQNPGFEVGITAGPTGWTADTPGYTFALDDGEPFEGERSLRIAAEEAIAEPPFPEHPIPGETVEKRLGGGLAAQVPLALYSDESGTWPRDSSRPLEPLRAALEVIDPDAITPDDPAVRLADVVIAWNVFQHFYPYFDVVDVRWEDALRRALEKALEDGGGHDFHQTLQTLLAAARDGHAGIRHPRYQSIHLPPFRVGWVEERVVVVATADTSSFRIGDVVVKVDGIDATTLLQETERQVSGSPQWRRHRALTRFAVGDSGTAVGLTLERGGQRFEVSTTRTVSEAVPLPERGPVERLAPGTWYMNLDTAPLEVIESHLDSLAAARGVIFDLRGYPETNLAIVLRHLLSSPDSTKWMFVPHILRPDQEGVEDYLELGWSLEPAAPRIAGKVAFVTNAEAISHSESILGFVEGYGLGEIVGSATAGTNGNVQFINLPGGFQGRFTGMKVLKHDGSQLHLVGILPTVPVEPTIEGIRAGRDEVLERAIEVVSGP